MTNSFLSIQPPNPNVLVDTSTRDDAGIYKLNETTALVETVDFITPVCDNPRAYGRVAAANALSDVYAMGGKPLTAMNLCMFPKKVPASHTTEILKGGLEKVMEASAYLIGGQTVEDEEMKYGLSVSGLVEISKMTPNSNAKAGDLLILTKAIGTGVLITAMRNRKISEADFLPVLQSMEQLNRKACEIMTSDEFCVQCCTDITGFGLSGHAFNISEASSKKSKSVGGKAVRLRFFHSKIPVFEPFLPLLKRKQSTRVTLTNRTVLEKLPDGFIFRAKLHPLEETIFFDPQTSGGLLIVIEPNKADACLKALLAAGLQASRIVGECFSGEFPGIEVVA